MANDGADRPRWQLDGRQVVLDGEVLGTLPDGIVGRHNRHNAVAALALARFAGVPPQHGMATLAEFAGVARRLQWRGRVAGVTVYDDFAHHPTAIAETIAALREEMASGAGRLVAVVDPRSNTMRAGVHAERLAAALADADLVVFHAPADLPWSAKQVLAAIDRGEPGSRLVLADDVDAVLAALLARARSDDQILIMSNGGFGGLHQRLLDALADQPAARAEALS